MSELDQVTLEDLEVNEKEEPTSSNDRDVKYQKLFRTFDLPPTEKMIKRYHCALQRKLQVNGHLYITTSFLLFYGNFPTKEQIKMQLDEITSLEKRKTSRILNNAISVKLSSGQEHWFSMLMKRDETFDLIERQRVEFEDWKKRNGEGSLRKKAEQSDAMLKNYNILKKIKATEIRDSLMEDQQKKSTCCTIV